ncbi:MAG: hypothetical protein PHG79_05955 [Methanosarcina sp.]|nr:hypothetical protein [Methanosarcina sp.]MDD4522816.1 hypothetical protein [Methanosarcina sp.]
MSRPDGVLKKITYGCSAQINYDARIQTIIVLGSLTTSGIVRLCSILFLFRRLIPLLFLFLDSHSIGEFSFHGINARQRKTQSKGIWRLYREPGF